MRGKETLAPAPRTDNVVDLERIYNIIDRARLLLRQEFDSRKDATNAFPSDISQAHIRAAVADMKKRLKLLLCEMYVPLIEILPRY